MTQHILDAGVWKAVKTESIKDGGVWKGAAGYVRDAGIWKPYGGYPGPSSTPQVTGSGNTINGAHAAYLSSNTWGPLDTSATSGLPPAADRIFVLFWFGRSSSPGVADCIDITINGEVVQAYGLRTSDTLYPMGIAYMHDPNSVSTTIDFVANDARTFSLGYQLRAAYGADELDPEEILRNQNQTDPVFHGFSFDQDGDIACGFVGAQDDNANPNWNWDPSAAYEYFNTNSASDRITWDPSGWDLALEGFRARCAGQTCTHEADEVWNNNPSYMISARWNAQR